MSFHRRFGSQSEDKGGVTFGVVQDPLHEDGVLGEPLGDQQDALLDAMATQQRPTTGTLILEDKDK